MLGDRTLNPPQPRSLSQVFVQNQKVLIGGLVIVLAIGYLIATSMQNTAVYYLTLPELRAKSIAPGEVVRVSGKVRIGSAQTLNGTAGVRFVMEDEHDKGQSIVVDYRGLVPDTFRDESDVVVEGKILPTGEFQAHTLLAKCPSKFTEA